MDYDIIGQRVEHRFIFESALRFIRPTFLQSDRDATGIEETTGGQTEETIGEQQEGGDGENQQ